MKTVNLQGIGRDKTIDYDFFFFFSEQSNLAEDI
jgi:hypothetical protein